MLKLWADFSDKLNSVYSIFVIFQYNEYYVNIMKSMKNRAYDKQKKIWEIGWDCYSQLIGTLNQYGIPYNGPEFMESIEDLKRKIAENEKRYEKDSKIDSSILDNVEFKTPPFSYQKEGIAYMLEHNRCLIGDEQGLGKSYQALNCATLKKGGKHCLIIAGYDTLQFNWVAEVEKHTNEKAYVLGQRVKKRTGRVYLGTLEDRLEDIKNLDKIEEFFIITAPTTIRQCIKQEYIKKNGKKGFNRIYTNANLLEEWCKKGEIGRIIYDEFQTAKNYEATQTEALLHIKSAPYKIAATGTPIMNRNLDLYPLMVWLGYENRNYYEFKNTYCIMGGYKNKEVKGNKNTADLHAKLNQFMIRRKKADVLDLPEKIVIDEMLEMDGKQWSLYENMKDFYKQKLVQMKGNKVELLASVLNLRKITCHPKWVDDEYKDSVKFERTRQLVYDIVENDQKVIIFSNWSTPIEWLYEELNMYNPAKITGDTKDRMVEVEKFQNDPTCKVILGTIGAMGTGLTLTAASNVIFLDEPWNRALKDQATDRCHRIGTKNNINVYTLICKGTMDEMVHKTVTKKGRVADEIVDGVTTKELEEFLGQ